MASDKDIQIGIRTTGTQEAAASIRKVDEQVERLGKDAPKAAAGVSKVSGDSSKLGFVANQVSMQVGDFTTQVAMGADALRAFSVQAPQVLGVLSSVGVVSASAGVALGVAGAAIPLVGIGLAKLVGPAQKSADSLAEIYKVSEGLGDKILEVAKAAEKAKDALNVQNRIDQWKALQTQMDWVLANARSADTIDKAYGDFQEFQAQQRLRLLEASGKDPKAVQAAKADLEAVQERNFTRQQETAIKRAQDEVALGRVNLAGAVTARDMAATGDPAQYERLKAEAEKFLLALEDANRKLEELKVQTEINAQTRGLQRSTDQQVANISSGGANDPGIQQAGRNITDAVLQAIGMVQGNARVSGREMTPGESEAVSQASQLLADTTPDSQQGAQLMAILQKLAGNLTEKDASLIGGLNQIINIVGTQTDAILKIQERIGALAAKVAQVGKITDEAMKVAQEAKSKAEAAEAQSKFATAESIKAAGQKAAAAAADSALAVAITKQLR